MVNICGKLYVYSGVSLKVSPWLGFRGLVESQSLTWRYSQCCVVNIFLTIRINMYTSRWERVVGDILLDCREMFDTGTSSLGNILQDYNLSNYNLSSFTTFLSIWTQCVICSCPLLHGLKLHHVWQFDFVLTDYRTRRESSRTGTVITPRTTSVCGWWTPDRTSPCGSSSTSSPPSVDGTTSTSTTETPPSLLYWQLSGIYW